MGMLERSVPLANSRATAKINSVPLGMPKRRQASLHLAKRLVHYCLCECRRESLEDSPRSYLILLIACLSEILIVHDIN